MKEFCDLEWKDLCARTRQSADHHANRQPDCREQIRRECDAFCELDPPGSYPQLLERVSEASKLAVSWAENDSRKTVKQSVNEPGHQQSQKPVMQTV